MRASLHTDLRVSGPTIADPITGLRYTLTPDAAWLVGQLLQEGHIERLVPAIARLRQLPEAEARRALFALLAHLGEFGGVQVSWDNTYSRGLRRQARWQWLTRQPASAWGFMRAMFRAYGGIFGPLQLGFVVAHLVLGTAFPLALTVLPALLVASFGVHELGHLSAARYLGVPVVLLARPGYLALLYKRPQPRTAQFIACAGPLAALFACLIAAALCDSFFAPAVLMALGTVHALSLLPLFADGKTLWRST